MKARLQRTLVIIKPEGIEWRLIGLIILMLEQAGLRIIGLKMIKPATDQLERHFPTSEDWLRTLGQRSVDDASHNPEIDLMERFGTTDPIQIGLQLRQQNITHYQSGRGIVCIVVAGPNAIPAVRKLIGSTSPLEANPSTIRGRFSTDSPHLANQEGRPLYNIIHAADSPETAQHEINVWFTPDEIMEGEERRGLHNPWCSLSTVGNGGSS